MIIPWQESDMATRQGIEDTRKVFMVPATFMVLADSAQDAERQLKMGFRFISPYHLGIMKAEIGLVKAAT